MAGHFLIKTAAVHICAKAMNMRQATSMTGWHVDEDGAGLKPATLLN